jgi:L-threonine kinase
MTASPVDTLGQLDPAEADTVCDCPAGPTTHGTFGELAQGYRRRRDGAVDHFLVTLPVEELSSTAEVAARAGAPLPPKAHVAFTTACQLLGVDPPELPPRLRSNIPVGKGFASSTADIVSVVAHTIERVAPHLDHTERHLLIAEVNRRLEYGDYLLHRGITLCNQRSHHIGKAFRTDLRWRIVGIDEGGHVDTADFHRRSVPDQRKLAQYSDIYRRLWAALADSDSPRAAAIASESALLHQDVLPKRSLPHMLDIASDTAAHGVCVAHSGTLVGLIFTASEADAEARMARAAERIASELHTTPLRFTVLENRTPAS